MVRYVFEHIHEPPYDKVKIYDRVEGLVHSIAACKDVPTAVKIVDALNRFEQEKVLDQLTAEAQRLKLGY